MVSIMVNSEFRSLNKRGDYSCLLVRKLDFNNPTEKEKFAKVMAHTFVMREPLTLHTGLTEEDVFSEISLYLEFAKKDNLTVVVEDTITKKIIGGIIGRDFFKDQNEYPFIDLPNKDKFQKIFNLLDLSKKEFLDYLEQSGEKLREGLVYRGFFIGFLNIYLNSYNKDGINIALFCVRKFQEYLQQQGFKYLYAETTNQGSKKLLESAGWNASRINISTDLSGALSEDKHSKKSIRIYGAFQHIGKGLKSLQHKHFNQYKEANFTELGFPHNLDFSLEELGGYLNFHINNAGDPRNHSNYLINSRDEEITVLKFFSKLYKLPTHQMWGYIASGGMEANEMGLYLARNKFPHSTIFSSADSHYSIKVIANKLQMKLVEIPSMDNGEIDYSILKVKIVESDTPPIVVCNIGTTMKGAIDNVQIVTKIISESQHTSFYIHCDAALHGGFLPFIDNAPKFNFELPIHSMAVSLHKFLGMPFPSAVFLTEKSTFDVIPEDFVKSQYNGQKINTLSCSRNGFAAICAYNRITSLGGLEGLKKITLSCMNVTEYAYFQLKKIGWKNVIKNDFSNIIVIQTPSKKICKKWQLAVDKNISHIIIMPHVTKLMVDLFINDLVESLQEDSFSYSKKTVFSS